MLAVQVATYPNAQVELTGGQTLIDTASLLYIASTFGLSLVVNAWLFFRISTSIFNPSITFALAITGAMSPPRAILVGVAQIAGGITAAALTHGFTPGPLHVGNRLGGGTTVAQGKPQSPQSHQSPPIGHCR
jgi:aquaporin rerated protein, other eukaryote